MPAALNLMLLLAAVVPAAAQDKPDFTGTWVLSNSTGAANVPTPIVVRESFKRESVNGVPLPGPLISMRVERHTASGQITPDDFTIGMVGGVVGATADGAQVRRNFSAVWDGDRLVLESTWSGRPVDAGTSSLHRETWEIDGAGLLRITTKDSIGLADFTNTTAIYRRRP